jgi:hypothetical protein
MFVPRSPKPPKIRRRKKGLRGKIQKREVNRRDAEAAKPKLYLLS